MSELNSRLFFGRVGHARHGPVRHRFSYRVAYFYIDLDELDSLGRKLPLFSHNRANLFSLHDKDHGDGSGTALRAWVEKSLKRQGYTFKPGKIYLLTMPRMLGYVFNPISVFYCFDTAGAPRAILYEVNNTFGERVSYLLEAKGEEPFRQSCRKAMYVSPFFEVSGHYSFLTRVPGQNLSLAISHHQQGQRVLSAWVSGRGVPLSQAALLRVLFRTPLLTYKVMLGIHWQALRLFLKGLKPFPWPGKTKSTSPKRKLSP